MYTDPATKLRVLTRYAHLERGKCCGSQCRHVSLSHFLNFQLSLFSVHMVISMLKLILLDLEKYSIHLTMNRKKV
jgi:hypothetical protein